jgi:acyl-CoA synthetase (NDP forming)
MIEMKDCETIIQPALNERRSFTLADEAHRIRALHHISPPPSALTSRAEEAVLKGKEIGFPVVVKVISPQLLHKSDVARA